MAGNYPPYLGSRMWISFVFQQKQGHAREVIVCCHMKGSQPILALNIRVSILLKEKACHLDVAVLGRNMERSETLLEKTKRKNMKNTLFKIAILSNPEDIALQ